jgi:hypothetical protein
LFTVVVTAFVGTWLIPTVIGWRKSRNQGKKLEYYYNQILNKKDIDKLDNLRNILTIEYTTGKIKNNMIS